MNERRPHHRLMRRLALVLLVMIAQAVVPFCWAAPYEQVAGLIDVRTSMSDGAYSVEQLVQMARERGFGALFITDHDRVAMAYGLPPFRNILKKSQEENSIAMQGPEKYLQAIRDAQAKYPDMVLIPGSETTPFYYWTGNPLSGSLTANDHERRLLTIGMESPDDYRQMPILHNRNTFAWNHLTPPLFFFLGSAILSGILIFFRGGIRVLGIVCLPLSLLLLGDSDPLRTSPFDAYSGDQGIAPYQLVIDYVNDRGGMTFWNYPETRSGVREMGPIRLSTKPYPGVLQAARGYTGFAVLYGDNVTVTEPGNLWDLVIGEYCRGYRMWPPWGIATADYHKEEKGGRLGNFPTVFLVREKTRQGVLKAMQSGKMYACQTSYPLRPRLDDFSVWSPDGQRSAVSGDEIAVKGTPKIRIAVSASGPGVEQAGPATIRLIRGGKVIASFAGQLPLTAEYEDVQVPQGEKTYYRMDMRGGTGIIVSNPIFVTASR